MLVHIVDGTYELFRANFGSPPATAPDGNEVGASRGLLSSLISLINQPSVTHIAVAFDHVVESFRNDVFDGYKSSEGIEPAILAQFEIAERITDALGIVTYAMVEFEADDALATAAAALSQDPSVTQIVLATPDKDLAQCVTGDKVVMWDRRRDVYMNADGVREKFGVSPASIPDWLGLVGDSADGIPGVPRWGAKSASTVLAEYEHIDNIPNDPESWSVKVRGAKALSENLETNREAAGLYRRLATLRTDVEISTDLDSLRYKGAHRGTMEALCMMLGTERPLSRIKKWAE